MFVCCRPQIIVKKGLAECSLYNSMKKMIVLDDKDKPSLRGQTSHSFEFIQVFFKCLFVIFAVTYAEICSRRASLLLSLVIFKSFCYFGNLCTSIYIR